MTEIYQYPQKYMLEKEACKFFGIKYRTYKYWLECKTIIPGRMKVKGSNYYVIDPILFDAFLRNTMLEEATPDNKFHNRKPIKTDHIALITANYQRTIVWLKIKHKV